MRRVLSVVFATIVGLVLLLSFHASPESAAITAPVSGASSTGTSAGVTAGGSTTSAGAGPPPTSESTTPTTAATSAAASGTYTGRVVTNRYGPVQVRITVAGSQLTGVVALQLPSDRPHSQRLSDQAGPILRTEALRAQSARIDVVSGATFTSESYAQSLQSALDQTHLGG